jgi:hypothetical protein
MLWSTFRGQGLPVTAFYDAQGKCVELSAGMLTQQQLQQHIKTNHGVDVVANDASKLAAPVIPLIPQGAYELLSTDAQDPSFIVDAHSRVQACLRHRGRDDRLAGQRPAQHPLTENTLSRRAVIRVWREE